MKGVILAGGLGTRLHPVTKVTNKHLIPVADKPMIYYPLQTLINAGIKKIMIITGNESAGDFLKLLGSGAEFGVQLTYRVQDGAGGIAHALSLAEDFVGDDKFVVILGDNIIEDDIKAEYEKFINDTKDAKIFLKEVQDPERFGVAEINGDKIVNITEKPMVPKTNYAVTGVYMYSPSVFDIIRMLKPSERGELEITDVNNVYIKQNSLGYSFLKGYWTDAGTFDSLFRATQLIKEHINKNLENIEKAVMLIRSSTVNLPEAMNVITKYIQELNPTVSNISKINEYWNQISKELRKYFKEIDDLKKINK